MARAILEGDLLLRGYGLLYYSPLYAYFCAAIYSIGGWANFDLLHLIQALIGAACCWMVWALARTWLERGPSAFAAGLAILARPWLFHEQLLLVEGLVLALNLAVLLLLRGAELERRAWRARLAVAGAASVLAYLGRGNFIVLIAAIPIWLFFRFSRPEREGRWRWTRGVASAGLYLAGGVVLMLPLALRNHAVAGQWRLGTTNGPALMYLGNAADASGEFRDSKLFSEAHAQAGRDPGVYMRSMRRDLRADPGAVAFNLLRKTYFFWNGYDLPDNASLYIGRHVSRAIRWTPVTATALMALGLVGAALSLRRGGEFSLLWIYLALFSASIVAIVPVGRYRLPVFAALMIFAAAGASVLARWARERRGWRIAAAAAALLAAVFLFAPDRSFLVRHQDYANFLEAALDRGKFAVADRVLNAAMRDYDRSTVLMKLTLWLSAELGDWDRAREAARFMETDRSFSAPVGRALALLYERDGRREEAVRVLDLLILSDPNDEAARRIKARIESGGPPPP
jgi:tetratricopeptide (TPR) repeat protein